MAVSLFVKPYLRNGFKSDEDGDDEEDSLFKKYALVRFIFCLMALLPNIDMLSDLYQIFGVYILQAWYGSALTLWVICSVNWRFNTLFAALHPKPTVWTLLLLFIPFLLLPCLQTIMKAEELAVEEDEFESGGGGEVSGWAMARGGDEALVDVVVDPTPLGKDRGDELYRDGTKPSRERLHKWISGWKKRLGGETNAAVKVIMVLRFEVYLWVKAVFYGPYFTINASMTLARDAWNDKGETGKRTPEQENNELNAIVLTTAEQVGEASPQLIVQTYTYHSFPQTTYETRIFTASTTSGVLGLLYAIYTLGDKYEEVVKHMSPATTGDPAQFLHRGYSARDALSEGFSVLELVKAGYQVRDMKEAAVEALNVGSIKLRRVVKPDSTRGVMVIQTEEQALEDMDAFEREELEDMGFSSTHIELAKLPVPGLKKALAAQGRELKGALIKDFHHVGVTVRQLGLEGVTASEMKSEGFSAIQLKNGGFTVKELKGNFSARDLVDAGFSAGNFGIEELMEVKPSRLKAGGYAAHELKDAGFAARHLRRAYTFQELKEAGFTVAELENAGYFDRSCSLMSRPSRLKAGGYAARELKDAGFTARNLKQAYTFQELKEAGFTAAELENAGCFDRCSLM